MADIKIQQIRAEQEAIRRTPTGKTMDIHPDELPADWVKRVLKGKLK
jgi:hypothetical protein|tara:strand:- start:308 stop:448 length:141 start_codon:yes stop_codon:yes gene_type:complete